MSTEEERQESQSSRDLIPGPPERHPIDTSTDVGPMVEEIVADSEAKRIEEETIEKNTVLLNEKLDAVTGPYYERLVTIAQQIIVLSNPEKQGLSPEADFNVKHKFFSKDGDRLHRATWRSKDKASEFALNYSTVGREKEGSSVKSVNSFTAKLLDKDGMTRTVECDFHLGELLQLTYRAGRSDDTRHERIDPARLPKWRERLDESNMIYLPPSFRFINNSQNGITAYFNCQPPKDPTLRQGIFDPRTGDFSDFPARIPEGGSAHRDSMDTVVGYVGDTFAQITAKV